MNRRIASVAALALLVAGSGLALEASAASVLKVSIPFEFSFGQTIFPAGDYQIEVRSLGLAMPTGSAVMIRSIDGGASLLVMTQRGAGIGETGEFVLFNRYGNNYFLSAVHSNSVSANVRRSEREKELAVAEVAAAPGDAWASRVLIAGSGR